MRFLTPVPLVLMLALLMTGGRALSFQPLRAPTGDAAVASSPTEDIAAFVDRVIPEQLRTRRIAGAVVSIVQDGHVAVSRGYGDADVQAGRRMGPDTRIRAASITKMFTGLAVMQLVERGKLDLDRNVNQYLDFEIPPSPGHPAVTLRRLLSHTSGFENRTGDVGRWSGGRPALGPYLARHLPPRLPQPDGVVAYSNVNASLAARAVERVSNQRFEDYLETQIFQPLQMARTSARQPLSDESLPEVSKGYVRADLPPTLVSMGNLTVFEVGSAGITTTADDMARLLLALVGDGHEIVTPSSLATMMTGQGDAGHGLAGLGLFSPAGSEGRDPFFGHAGNTGGFSSLVAFLPSRRFGLFVSYNSEGMPASTQPRDELISLVAERYFPEVEHSHGRPVEHVEGTYEMAGGAVSTLFALRRMVNQMAVGRNGGVLTIRPAILPFGDAAQSVAQAAAAGEFRWRGRTVSFGEAGGVATMTVGSPTGMMIRIPWWRSVTWMLPLLLASLIVTVVTMLRWVGAGVVRLVARRPSARHRDVVIRVALLCHVLAIALACWFAFAGWPLAAASSPGAPLIGLTIYGLAWGGVLLTPLAVWRALRSAAAPGAASARVRATESLLALITVGLSFFCLYWRIAGWSLAF